MQEQSFIVTKGAKRTAEEDAFQKAYVEQNEEPANNLDYFCDFTGMEGFRFLHSRNATVFRLIAIVLMTACVSLFCYQTVDRIFNYIRHPVVINSEQLEYKEMTFPNLILCAESQYRVITKDAVSPEFGRLLRRIFTESREIPEVDQLGAIYERLKIATRALEETIKQRNVTNNRTNATVFSELEKLGHKIINILPETGRLLMTHNIKHFLDLDNDAASVDFEQFKNSQLLWDSCLRFQALGREKRDKSGKKVIHMVNSTLETALCRARKAEDAIEQIIHLDLSRYFLSLEHDQQELIIKCSWLDVPCKIDKVWTSRGTCFKVSAPNSAVAASRVVGQSSAIHLLIDTFAFEGDPTVNLFLRPSTMKEFSLTSGDLQLQAGQREKFAINQVIKIYRHKSRCGSIPVPGFSSYVQGTCQWDHRQKAIQEKCNCSWFFGTSKPSTRSTNETHENCNFTKHHGCASYIQLGDDDCPRDCIDEQYQIDRAITPLLTSAYVSSLPSDWTARTKRKLDKFVKIARRTRLTSYACKMLQKRIEEFFAFHLQILRLFYMKYEMDRAGDIRYIISKMPLHFLHEDENEEDNILGMQRLSTYLSQQPAVPCLLDQQELNSEETEQLMLVWSKPIKTYQEWLREEIFLPDDCVDGQLCSGDRYNDDVNMATTITVSPNSINIADFARYYYILQHMDRLQHLIEQLKIQLKTALTTINDAAIRHFHLSIANRTRIQECLVNKRNMIFSLLNTSVLTSSASDEKKSAWFVEFEDLIQLDESKAYIPGRTYDKANLVEVTVFFRSLTRQTITQASSCTIWMLLSEIGGTMGMYLGATVITGFELILFICNLRRKKFCKLEHQLNAIHRRRQSVMSRCSLRSRTKKPLSQCDSVMSNIRDNSANFSRISKQEKMDERD